MIKVDVDIKGPVAMINALTNNLSAQSFKRLAETEINNYVHEETRKNFTSGGKRAGGWADIKQETKDRKGSGKILREADILMEAASSIPVEVSGYTATWSSKNISGESYDNGNSVRDIMVYHQANAKRTAKRPILVWNKAQDEPKLTRMVETHIMKI